MPMFALIGLVYTALMVYSSHGQKYDQQPVLTQNSSSNTTLLINLTQVIGNLSALEYSQNLLLNNFLFCQAVTECVKLERCGVLFVSDLQPPQHACELKYTISVLIQSQLTSASEVLELITSILNSSVTTGSFEKALDCVSLDGMNCTLERSQVLQGPVISSYLVVTDPVSFKDLQGKTKSGGSKLKTFWIFVIFLFLVFGFWTYACMSKAYHSYQLTKRRGPHTEREILESYAGLGRSVR